MGYETKINQLSPNFAEIELTSGTFNFYRADYSKQLYDECRDDPNKDYFYCRSTSSKYLYALPKKANLSKPRGFTREVIKVDEELQVLTKLISLTFQQYFESKKRHVHYEQYSSRCFFTIDQEEKELIGDLELIPTCYFSVHNLVSSSGKIVFILAISREYKFKFNCTVKTLNERNIDTRDFITKEERIIPNRENIKKYLSRTGLQRKYDSKYTELMKKEHEYTFIQKTFNYLSKANELLEINRIDNVVNKINYLSLPNTNFAEHTMSKPTQYYYNNTTYQGLIHSAVSERRPFSYDMFNGIKIRICAFIPNTEAKQCEKFIEKISSNLRVIFHLNNVEIEYLYVGNNRQEHINLISKFDNKQYDLSLLFLKNSDKNQNKLISDYNKLKAKLISKQIPSQTILIENVQKNDEYTLRNISLNLYAKLGGTAWSVEKESIDMNEFIIGIGSTIDKDGNRNIGFANIFDYSGAYLVGSCTPYCQIDDYASSLKEYLHSLIIKNIIENKNIMKGSKIRLIFHIFKEASEKYELSAIRQCLEEFSDYNIEFAIINVSYEHPYKLFRNISDNLVRGSFISLGPNQALLSMGGIGNKPLQIKLDKRSTYKDLFELSRQVLYFSYLSYRSFMPANSPVTVKYSQILAKLTNDLLLIPNWDNDMLNHMREKLWFI